MSEAAVKIAIRGLSKSFGANHVLTELDLDIRQGESLVIIGASGQVNLSQNIVGILTPDLIDKNAGEEVVGVTGNSRDRINRKPACCFSAALFTFAFMGERSFGLMSAHRMGRDEGLKSHVFLEQVGYPKPTPIATLPTSRPAPRNGSRWRARSLLNPKFCFSTSPPPESIQ